MEQMIHSFLLGTAEDRQQLHQRWLNYKGYDGTGRTNLNAESKNKSLSLIVLQFATLGYGYVN